MTCVIGLVESGKVWMGGDSASGSGLNMRISKIPKVWRQGEFLFGTSGSWRTSQVLMYKFAIKPQLDDTSIEQYMVSEFVESLRQCLKEAGLLKNGDNYEEGNIWGLVGYRARLFSIYSDLQVNEYADSLDTLGSGSEYAMGAMLALAHTLKPRKRIRRALEIAATHNNGTAPPFTILNS